MSSIDPEARPSKLGSENEGLPKIILLLMVGVAGGFVGGLTVALVLLIILPSRIEAISPQPVTVLKPVPEPKDTPTESGNDAGKAEPNIEPDPFDTSSSPFDISESPFDIPPKTAPKTVSPDPLVVTPVKPDPPVGSPEERRLFASLTEISLQINSYDRNPQNQVNQMLATAPKETIERTGLAVTNTKQAVFSINLESKMAGDFVEMTLSGELVCRDKDGTAVKIWEKRDQVLQARRSLSTTVVFRILRENVQKFLVAFVSDYTTAKNSSPPAL